MWLNNLVHFILFRDVYYLTLSYVVGVPPELCATNQSQTKRLELEWLR